MTFVQVDVGAAVDVMQLIEKANKGGKRDDMVVTGMGFEEEMYGDWNDEWLDFDEDEDDTPIQGI